jgi:hypothetical protein
MLDNSFSQINNSFIFPIYYFQNIGEFNTFKKIFISTFKLLQIDGQKFFSNLNNLCKLPTNIYVYHLTHDLPNSIKGYPWVKYNNMWVLFTSTFTCFNQ